MTATDAITVWVAPLDAVPEALWPRLQSILDATERERAEWVRMTAIMAKVLE